MSSSRRSLTSLLLFCLAAAACLALYQQELNELLHFPFRTHVLWLLRIGLLLLALYAGLQVFVREVVRKQVKHKQNLWSTFFGLFSFFILLEIVFMFVPQSHGIGHSYATKIWNKYYWNPINRFGYRDTDKTGSGQKNLLIVGDSFTAAQGIKDIKKRFGEQLEELSGGHYQVHNLGWSGADTKEAYRRLLAYPVKPDVLVLQYYGNDIEYLAQDHGLHFSGFEPYADVSAPVAVAVKASFLLNFLYWQFPHTDGNGYVNFLLQAYQHPQVLQAHLDELGLFVQYASAQQIPLVVVVFPFLQDPQGSRFYTEPVLAYLNEQNIPAIDVGKLTAHLPLEERVINRNDMHASEAVHTAVAAALHQKLHDIQADTK